MRKPELSAEVFLAALAVLTTACTKKADSAAPEPAAVAPTPTAAATAATPATATAAASAAVAAEPPPTPAPHAAGVDAGREVKPRSAVGRPPAPEPARAPDTKKANAACGASGCSPEMKKDNK